MAQGKHLLFTALVGLALLPCAEASAGYVTGTDLSALVQGRFRWQ